MASPSFPSVLERRSIPEVEFPSRPSIPRERAQAAPPPPPPPRRRRVARILLGLSAGLGLSVVFVSSLAVSLLVHLDAPSARRAIARLGSDAASKSLRGRVEITSIDRISPRAIDIANVRVHDLAGRTVLAVRGTHVRYDLSTVARTLLAKKTPTVDRLVVDAIDVLLVPENGEPTLLQALEPRERTPPKGPAEKPPSTFRFAIGAIDVRHAAVNGVAGGMTLDLAAELEGASLLLEPSATHVHVPRLGVVSAPIEGALPSTTQLDVAADLRIPAFSDPDDLPVIVEEARLAVQANGARVGVHGRTDARTWSLRIDLPEVAPATLARFLDAPPPLAVPIGLSLDASGDTEHAQVEGAATLGGASVGVRGTIDLGALGITPNTSLARVELGTLDLALRGVDPHAFAAGAPAIALSADLHAHAAKTLRGTEVVVDGRGDTAAFDTSGTLAIDARGVIGAKGAVDGAGAAHVTLGRSSVDASFTLDEKSAHATIAARAPALDELRPITRQPLRGALELSAAADVDLKAKTVSASASAHAVGLQHPSVSLPDGVVAARVEGPWSSPAFAGAFTAPEVTVAKNRLRDVDARVTGTPTLVGGQLTLLTEADQKITLDSHVRPTAGGASFLGTHATVRRDDFAADLAIKEVALERGTIRVDGLRLASTAGGLRVDARLDPRKHHLDVRAKSTPIDLAALAHGLAIDTQPISGKALIDADLATIDVDRAHLVHGDESALLGVDPGTSPDRAVAPHANAPYVTGRLRLDLDDADLPQVGPITAHVDVGVEDRLVLGAVGVRLRDLAEVALHGAALVPGRIDDAASWKQAVGQVDLDVPRVDLKQLSAMLQQTPLAGIARVTGHVERHDAKAPPSGNVTFSTEGFAAESGTTRVEGVDLRARLALSTKKDVTDASGTIELHDDKGPLAFVSVGTHGPWSKLLASGSALADLPFSFAMLVPPRDLGQWPRALAEKIPLHGTLALAAKGEGTLGAPKLDLRARLGELTALDGSIHDADLRLDFDGEMARWKAFVSPRVDPKKTELLVTSEVLLPAASLLAGNATWSARLDAKIEHLPLELLSTAIGVKGALSGELHVDHLHDPAAKAATVDGRIDVAGLAIGDARFDESFVTVAVDEQRANATLALHGKDGRLDAQANVPLVWANGLPSVGPNGAIDARLDAQGLRLRVAEPFVTAVDALDGLLDAHVVAHVARDPMGKWTGAPEGELHVHDAVVVADAVGERWEHVGADVKLTKGHVELSGLELKGRAGGTAKLKGTLDLAGFTPQKLHVELDTKRFPIAASGAKVGDLTSKITVDGKAVPIGDGRDRLDLAVTLDDTTMDLAPEAGKKVQSLDEDPSVVVQQPIAPPVEPPPPPGQGTPMRVTVNIPQPVWVRRDDLRIALRGNPKLSIDGPTTFSGAIFIQANPGSRLQQPSWVEVLGKRFYVQPSRVAFEGNQELDPALDLEVRWQAPDRSIVQIKVTGHLSAPKVDFKGLDENGSPLGLTRGEVMSLLVLGRRDAGSAQQQQQAERGAAAQAAALVSGMTGSIVGRQLQKMLPASINISLTPGKYSGGYQHDNVYFEVGYNASGSQMGPQGIGQSSPRTTFLVDWRFARKWSLITTLGDTGSALVDLLWHYRY